MQLRKSPHFQVKNYVFQTFRKHYSSLVAHISHIYLLNPVFFFHLLCNALVPVPNFIWFKFQMVLL